MPKTKSEKDHYRDPTPDEQKYFDEFVSEGFCQMILAEGAICRIRALTTKDDGQYKVLVVASGICYTVKYYMPQNRDKEPTDMTVEKTKDKQCSIM